MRKPAPRSPSRRRRHARPWARWLKTGTKWAATAAVWGLVLATAAAAWYATDLPDVDKALAASRRPTVSVVAADGTELATFGDLYAMPVRLADLPDTLTQAVLATEDRRFYDHYGIDPIGLMRALYANLKAGRIVQGGSTITQQVAKNLFLTPERTVKRKVQELMLALWLEHRFTKDQILTVYLNRVYLGAGTFGVEAAARKYFAKPASAVSTYEAAMLAGLLKAPSRYNPIASPRLAAERAGQVLANMAAAGFLSSAEARAARDMKDLSAAPTGGGRVGRYFADWVLEQVSGYVTPGNRDLTVITTLDPWLQRRAEAATAAVLAKAGAGAGVSQAALVAMSPGGGVRAMVGGRAYASSKFNRATQARRQPGSAFKPIVYLAGLESGLTPETRLVDKPIEIGGWRPRNFSRKHRGEVSLRQALAHSINTVAVQVGEKAGLERVVETARRLGLTTDLKAEPSLTLGAGEVSLIELTAAYGVFANGGAGVWPYGIEEIRDSRGRVLYRRAGSGPGRVVDPLYVAAMNDMLSEVITSGTGRAAALSRPAAGKTGTSQNFRDAWFVGYSADLVAGVWMGNDDASPMRGVTGGGLPAKLWRDFMAAAHQGTPPRPLPGLPAVAEEGFLKGLLARLAGDG